MILVIGYGAGRHRAYPPRGIDSTRTHPFVLEVFTVTHVDQSASAAVPPGGGDESTDLSAVQPPATSTEAPASFKDVVAAYVGLTKPRVIELLLL
ncbi:MAG: hypothetical protein JWN68_1646, partial [Nocardioides sp.]|nr:hypothetical protein [Nocardioides sp.]